MRQDFVERGSMNLRNACLLAFLSRIAAWSALTALQLAHGQRNQPCLLRGVEPRPDPPGYRQRGSRCEGAYALALRA